MNTKLRMPALLIAAALSGCASGGGSSSSSGNPDVLLCALTIIYCFKLAADQHEGEEAGGTSASGASSSFVASAPPRATFSTWAQLERDLDKTTYATGLTTQASHYWSDGAVASTSVSGQFFDSEEHVEHGARAKFGYFWASLGTAVDDLAAVGHRGIEVKRRDYPTQGAQSAFSALPSRGTDAMANPHTLGWDYQAFGVWESGGIGGGSMLASSIGSPTPVNSVPTSGSASFTGKLAGLHLSPSGEGSVAAADLNVRVDFSARSLAFASTGTTLTRDAKVGTAAPHLNLSGTLTYAQGSNTFSGTLSNAGATLSGESKGRFYGPAAQELGGVFTVKSSSTTEILTGAYGAKR
jgi:hypothetical protein